MCHIMAMNDPVSKDIYESIRKYSSPSASYWKCVQTFLQKGPQRIAAINSDFLDDEFAWVTQLDTFQVWMTSKEGCVLQLMVEPGLSALSDRLIAVCRMQRSIVIHFSFDRRNPSHCSTDVMLASFISQLLAADPACFTRVENLYYLINKQSKWTLSSLWTFFRSLLLVPRSAPAICIIDGYHNCDVDRGYFLSDLLLLAQSTVTTVKMIIAGASNTLPSVPSHLMIELNREQETHAQLAQFVTRQLTDLCSRDPSFLPFERHLRQTILGRGATFLTATTIIRWLRDLEERSTQYSMNSVLSNIPSSHDEGLRVCMLPRLRMKGHPWAERVLLWVTHAFRPLHVDELGAALALSNSNGQYAVDDNELPRNLPKDLGHVFGSFLNVQNGVVMVRNESLHEALYASRADWDSAAGDDQAGHGGIANICISYILANEAVAETAGERLESDSLAPSSSPALLEYACQFWNWHYARAQVTESLENKALQLLGDADYMSLCCRLQGDDGLSDWGDDLLSNQLVMAARMGLQGLAIRLCGELSYNDQTLSKVLEYALTQGGTELVKFFLEKGLPVQNVLHLAAANGHLRIVQSLQDARDDVNTHDQDRMTPLILASKSGYKEVVDLLLSRGATVDGITASGRTALHFAAEFGHSEVMEYLIQHGASVATIDNAKCTPLHLATRSSQLEAIQVLIRNEADLNALEEDLWAPLHFASSSGFVEAVRILIKNGSKINAKTASGATALQLAVLSTDLETVRELLNHNPVLDTQATDTLETPLHLAAQNGLSDIMQELIQCRGDVNMRRADGYTPLHLAAENGHVQILRLLLDGGSALDTQSSEGLTALHTAAAGGHCGAIQVLLEAGADPSAQDLQGSTPAHHAVRRGILEAVRILTGWGVNFDISAPAGSLLHAAVENEASDIVRFLLDRGESPKAVNMNGSSLLHLAAKTGNMDVLGLLLQYGVEVDRADFKERTPLMFAAQHGHRDASATLLAAEADVTNTDEDDRTPLHFAARGGHRDVVDLLLSHGADARAADSTGQIPLHLAAELGHSDTARAILAGANGRRQIKSTDSHGRTALHLAASNGQLAAAELLLAHGANPATVDTEGRTPLHVATIEGNMGLVALLADSGADLDQKNEDGETAIHLAERLGHRRIVGLLQDKGADLHLVTADGTSLLHLAAASNDVDMARKLLSAQHDPNATNRKAETPLLLAAAGGHHEVVQVLLDAQARLEGSVDSPRAVHKTPLYTAAQAEHAQTAQSLLRAGANVNFVWEPSGKTPFSWLIQHGWLELIKECLNTEVNPDASPGWPPIYTAAYYGQSEIVKLLLSHGMDPEQCGADKWTPLHAAFDSTQVTRALLDAGVMVDPQSTSQSTPLYLAAYNDYDETAVILLNHGANAFFATKAGDTPFHNLMRNSRIGEIEAILQRPGCTLNMQDQYGRTPLWVAVSNGADEVVELLLSQEDTDVTLTDLKGVDLLTVAITEANVRVVEILLRRGLKITAKHDRIPGRCAAQGQLEILTLLRDHGANLDAADEHGWTPQLHAKSANQQTVLTSLWPNLDLERHIRRLNLERPRYLSASAKSVSLELDDSQLVASFPTGETSDSVAPLVPPRRAR
jgi:ankyrin repeat protein